MPGHRCDNEVRVYCTHMHCLKFTRLQHRNKSTFDLTVADNGVTTRSAVVSVTLANTYHYHGEHKFTDTAKIVYFMLAREDFLLAFLFVTLSAYTTCTNYIDYKYISPHQSDK